MENGQRLLIHAVHVIIAVQHKAHAGAGAHGAVVKGRKVQLGNGRKIRVQNALLEPLTEQLDIASGFIGGHVQNQLAGGIVKDGGSLKGRTHCLGNDALHNAAFSADIQRCFHTVTLHGKGNLMELLHGGGQLQPGCFPIFLVDDRAHAGFGRLGIDGGKVYDPSLLGDDIVIDARVLKQVVIVGRIFLQIGGQIHINVLVHCQIIAAGVGRAAHGNQGLKDDMGEISRRNHQIKLLRCRGLIGLSPVDGVAQILLGPLPEHCTVVGFGGMGAGTNRIEHVDFHRGIVDGQGVVCGHCRCFLRKTF